MTSTSIPYGHSRALGKVPFDGAVERITAALKEQGFGVLTRIDVQETMKQKLGVDFRRYVILGACNPQLAHRAFAVELSVGLLLPCNVTVFEDDAGEVVVQAVKPAAMLEVVRNPAMKPIADEADVRLRRALEQA